MYSYVLMFLLLRICAARKPEDHERFIIACHSTDFTCFKYQYKSLRDHVLMGNLKLGIPEYEPYVIRYGDTGTCVQMSGLEDSYLTGIRLDSIGKQFYVVIEMPFRIQQVQGTEQLHCARPDTVFDRMGKYKGPLKNFNGNATVRVTYPYELRRKKDGIHMFLKDENLDVILDIPDLSQYRRNNEHEKQLYEMSEWAYGIVQHVDAAQHFALPYTTQLRQIHEFYPLRRLIVLYPHEEYADLHFRFMDDDTKNEGKV